jgi:hypothetical protein
MVACRRRDGSSHLPPQILDAASQFIFGESTEAMLPGGSDLGRQFKSSLNSAQDGLTKMTMMGPFALFHQGILE